MRQLYYNRLRNKRIKAIFLGLLSVLIIIVAVVPYARSVGSPRLSAFHATPIIFITIGLLYTLGLITFGHVIEAIDDDHFATYFRLGGLQFRYKTFSMPARVLLEQDSTRYYCLKIYLRDGESFTLERHPTLGEANARLQEVKAILQVF